MLQQATAHEAEPYEFGEARALVTGLGLSDPVAVALVRRGYRTVEDARRFLEADESHDPFAFEAMEEIVSRLLAAGKAGRRITVHGDYDVDGVVATAILVAALRRLGATCDWHIPARGDGYGLSTETVTALAARGTEILVTVDCGIGAIEEVAAARAAGLEVIVTDHHSPGPDLPDCPILHPTVSNYPFPDLCGAGVAHKLCSALATASGKQGSAEEDLDVVALATVADLVPLRGENRSLVRRGLAAARLSARPGLRALMEVSGTDPAGLDESSLGFRLAPRINAAGRLYRADAGVELLLTDDSARAGAIAVELDQANRERRETEQQVLWAAERAIVDLPAELAEAPALVVAGEGWHPGVVGIVASRLVEQHNRPVIVIAMDGGSGRGSGRSIGPYDLLAGLEACSEHLLRFGGHRMAAGLEIDAGQVDRFREAFAAHAGDALGPQDLVRRERMDAVVGGDSLGLDLAEELGRLGPFGAGNPGVRLLVPSATVTDVRPMGEGKHARFSLVTGTAKAAGVAFGRGSVATGGEPHDVSVRLEANAWNGAVEPRVVLREIYPAPLRTACESSCAACPQRAADGEWWGRFDDERVGALDEAAPGEPPQTQRRQEVDRRGRSAVAAIADLLTSGERVLAVCADTSRRRGLAEQAVDPFRFGGGGAVLASARCAGAPMAARLEQICDRGLVLVDYGGLEREPAIAARFAHVVLVDPPPFSRMRSLAAAAPAAGEGYLHLAWGPADIELALKVHEHAWETRGALREIFKVLRSAGGSLAGEQLVAALEGAGAHPRTPEHAGRCARVLEELSLVEIEGNGGTRSLRVVSSEKTDLERSRAFLAYRARLEEGKQYLSRQKQSR